MLDKEAGGCWFNSSAVSEESIRLIYSLTDSHYSLIVSHTPLEDVLKMIVYTQLWFYP